MALARSRKRGEDSPYLETTGALFANGYQTGEERKGKSIKVPS